MRSVATLLLLLTLTACGKDAANTSGATGDAADQLPAPEKTRAGVTGMPNRPGPGHIGAPEPQATQVAVDGNGNPLPPDGAAVDGTTPGPDVTPIALPEPSTDDAIVVVRDYYAAINAGDFGRAQSQWADGGRASRQSPEQFAGGFADTTGVSLEVMAPGDVEGAAGSRYIEVPVAITATRRDGSQHRFAGTYVLRRSVVDGASDEQRAWRISSARIHPVVDTAASPVQPPQ
ncbi:hypothetical protein [Lysobacter fragariae]